MHATQMVVAPEWKWDVELYILYSGDSTGLLIYDLGCLILLSWKISLLQIMFTFTIDLDLMLLDYQYRNSH